MLSVPDEIKNILHEDTCFKNIRIHFPNGERSDICNDQIVMDSVSFTESLCSQDMLKFGLCEASVFECEVVGVSNVSGATIEVTCEVFCPSTVEGAEWKADLEQWVYSIPYGTFVIDEAKRQADIIHRKIVAYNSMTIRSISRGDAVEYPPAHFTLYTNIKADNQEIVKDYVIKNYNNSLVYDPFKRLYARLGYFEDDSLELTEITSSGGFSHKDYFVKEGICFGAQYVSPDAVVSDDISQANTGLYLIQMNDLLKSLDEIYEWACENLHTYASGDAYTEVKQLIHKYLYDGYNFYESFEGYDFPDYVFTLYGNVGWYGRGESSSDSTLFTCPINQEKIYLYPYNYTRSGEYAGITVRTPINIIMGRYGTPPGGSVPTIIDEIQLPIRNMGNNEGMTVYEATSDIFGLTTLTQKRIQHTTALGTRGYVLDGTVNDEFYQKLFEAFFELRGLFAIKSRENALKWLNIKQQFGLLPANNLYPDSNLYPEGVTGGKLLPEDYQTCWYGDEYTKLYGAVQCEYKNTNNEDCKFTLYLNGFTQNTETDKYQVYDLSGNYIITTFKWTQAQIEAFCNAVANNIEGVTYMPVEFVGRGLPYVEAGDTFEILTGSNDSITTIVLRRTISGEMVLTDSYKSV